MAPHLGFRIAKADGESSGFPALNPQKGFRGLFGNEESKLRKESVCGSHCRRKPGIREPLTTHHSARSTGNRRIGWRCRRERGLERRLRAGEGRKLAGMPARLHRVAEIGIDVVASRSSSAHTTSSARGGMITGGSRQKLVRQLPRFALGKTKYLLK